MICNMTKGSNAYGLMKYLLGEKWQNGHAVVRFLTCFLLSY